MRRIGMGLVVLGALAASGCRLFNREPTYYPAPQAYCQPCQPCQPACVPTTQCPAGTVPCVPVTAQPILGR